MDILYSVLHVNAKKLSFSDSPLAEQINKSIKVITLQTLSAGSDDTKLGIQPILYLSFFSGLF
jgi:hypothetical protein